MLHTRKKFNLVGNADWRQPGASGVLLTARPVTVPTGVPHTPSADTLLHLVHCSRKSLIRCVPD